VSDATSISIDHGIGAVALSGSTSVSPTITTTYTLTATNTSGSVNATTTVTVDEQQEEVGYGVIEVDSNPEGAKIYLDGLYTGQVTPAILTDIESGNRTIKLTFQRYKNWEEAVTLDAGQTLTFNIIMIEAEIEDMEIMLSDSNGKDAGVETANEDTNYGNLYFFAVGNSSAPNTARAYLKFDLSEIPNDAVILSEDAYLSLYMFDYWGSGGTHIYHHQVLENWQEDEITWSNQPDEIFSDWISEGYLPSSLLGHYVKFDITSYLSGDWKNKDFYKYGVVLRGNEEIFAPLFYSSEYSEANKRPKLNFRYYIP
jgi:hypothetical protein